MLGFVLFNYLFFLGCVDFVVRLFNIVESVVGFIEVVKVCILLWDIGIWSCFSVGEGLWYFVVERLWKIRCVEFVIGYYFFCWRYK